MNKKKRKAFAQEWADEQGRQAELRERLLTKTPKRIELNEPSIVRNVIRRGGKAELIDVERRPCNPMIGDDYEQVVFHFSNGGEVNVYLLANGSVLIEGD